MKQLFKQTRWRLTIWYAGMMGGILSLCGLGVYEAIDHAHRVTVDQELKSVAGTLHDSLEPVLISPGKLEPAATRLLPDLCLVNTSCYHPATSHHHTVDAITEGSYYMRLYDVSGRLIAVAGLFPPSLPFTPIQQQWITVKDNKGQNYRQISFILQTQTNQNWGYLQVGRNLQDFEAYVTRVKWILLLGLPVAMILIGLAAWWLAGLAMKPIYQSYQQIQQFTADAAHELRTPLAATRATIESILMLPKISETETKDTLTTLGKQNQRLSLLVADLLMLSRMDQQLMQSQSIFSVSVNLNDLVNDVAEELAALALANHIDLTTDIRVKAEILIQGNPEQVYRLISNLVANSIQFTPSLGKVILRLDQTSHHALIQVQDTGIGIPLDEQQHIFDRFYRINSSRSRLSGGFGLGLAICQAITQAHGGTIDVKSEVAKGSLFTLRLPLGKNQ